MGKGVTPREDTPRELGYFSWSLSPFVFWVHPYPNNLNVYLSPSSWPNKKGKEVFTFKTKGHFLSDTYIQILLNWEIKSWSTFVYDNLESISPVTCIDESLQSSFDWNSNRSHLSFVLSETNRQRLFFVLTITRDRKSIFCQIELTI